MHFVSYMFLQMSLPTLRLVFLIQVASWANVQLIPIPLKQPFEVQTQREIYQAPSILGKPWSPNPAALAHKLSHFFISWLLPRNLHVLSGVLSLEPISLGPCSV